MKNCKFFCQKKSIIENVLNSSFYNEGFLSKHLGECIALFTLLRYRQVLPTKGLSPLPIPHSDENCYKNT
ncbi:unknown protein [Microcystis aeruginosa NIES-843]|uniref:Uncharacterized protein n=1 Tax=Microcystis aeruginosa (strain NIES-843 / IAM M-2473) TaxID=449447 RepID=B0JW74_MICAN|nr:unknown protein [Microcystis aeruginosa NIES-843]